MSSVHMMNSWIRDQMEVSSSELLRVVPLSHGTTLGGVQFNMLMMVEGPFGSKAKFSGLCFKPGIWLNLEWTTQQIKNVESRSLRGCSVFAVKLMKETSQFHMFGQKTSLINSVPHECTQMSVLRCSLLISRGAVDSCPWQTDKPQ